MPKTHELILGFAIIVFSFLIYSLLTRDNDQYKREHTPTVYLDPCGRNTPEAEIFNPDHLRAGKRHFEARKNQEGLMCEDFGCVSEIMWMWGYLGFISGMGPGAYNDPNMCIEETLKEKK